MINRKTTIILLIFLNICFFTSNSIANKSPEQLENDAIVNGQLLSTEISEIRKQNERIIHLLKLLVYAEYHDSRMLSKEEFDDIVKENRAQSK